ncbi:Rab proteins geranylgeranyltransferase component A [Orbilia brochopaga]|uniref:Rab proteins geranylgeranyltransferase component A n=1 Tax=Orbilia brochopaga TaxID=3140254 RepID=A0AAV9UWQ4_9PEZI
MNIESLNESAWDAVISGTGLRESLLAAALARAGKKVLHVDKNPYYGDEYAALSLAELEAWATNTRSGRLKSVEFRKHETKTGAKLAESRSYTLNFAPGLLYTTSPLLSLLVDINLHESLEFLKVGGWFVYRAEDNNPDSFMAVPNSREDVFNDPTLDPRTKRIVVRALKSILGFENSIMKAPPSAETSLQEYLEGPSLSLPPQIVAAFTSLTLLHDLPSAISFERAESDIRKHFGSLGRFGPGFAAVIARYGSGSELVQVLCRAAAVTGNAIYVLDNAVTDIQYRIARPPEATGPAATTTESDEPGLQLRLQSGDVIWTRHFIATRSNQPSENPSSQDLTAESAAGSYWMSLYVVSSPLKRLFRTTDPPTAAGAVLYMPAGELVKDDNRNDNSIYIFAHSNETGECPNGQSLLYISTKDNGSKDDTFLDIAATSLLERMPNEDGSVGEILASVRYRVGLEPDIPARDQTSDGLHSLREHVPVIKIPDEVLDEVLDLYEAIIGSRDGFMDKQGLEDQAKSPEDIETQPESE